MVLPFVLPPAAVPPTLDLPSTPAPTHASASTEGVHVVREGETLFDLAARYRTSVAAIQARSGLSSDVIHPGQRLEIPRGGAPGARSAAPSRSASTRGYTVRAGDTLSGIAARHDMSLARLRALNSLGSTTIHPGQRLRVHGSASAPQKRSAGRGSGATHDVRPGETLSGIAGRYGMSVSRLTKLNGISAGSFIHPGQRLSVQRATRPARSPGADFDDNTFAGRTYPARVVSAAGRNREALAGRAVPSRAAVHDRVVTTARRHGVDPSLALAISYQESGWDQRQVSVANAVGVMQVIPSSGQWASQLAGRELDLLDTDDNITAGVLILRVLTQAASSDSQAIAGYYQGLASVQANGMYPDTRHYVATVKHHRARM